MSIGLMRPEEVGEVHAMMRALWPDFDDDIGDERVFVWRRPGGGLGGFASMSLRPWAEGCASTPCPYLEGWWVAADVRRQGVGHALLAAVEAWCREAGHRELASDVHVDNHGSLAAHVALGFAPTERLQFFRKPL
jgi:aminoglycoside 6'-N-acetyltransferase I